MQLALNRFDHEAFLRDTWQQKPLLIRQAWTAWRNPLEPDELAGLACEAGVESRLVVGAAGALTLEHGPIPEDRFGQLGERDWTLLVQAVDHHVAEVAALIEPFRFIPNWRIDDIMVSYATDGGGVGPHFDQYDVFLVQGLGRRRWRIGGRCDDNTPLAPHDDLRLIADFTAIEEWILEPGDMLYLPPGVAHEGTAMGDDCMTYSIGFRAPSRADLIGHWADETLAGLAQDDRYTDPGLVSQSNPGEISGQALTRLHAMLTQTLQDRDSFAQWFGCYASARKYPEVDWHPEDPITPEQLREALAKGAVLERNPASRFAFVEHPNLSLFVDGQCYPCSAQTEAFAKMLCAQIHIKPDPQQEEALKLITELYNQGSLTFA